MEGFSITFPGLLQGGAVGVLFLVFYLTMSGRIVAKSTLDTIVAQEQKMAEVWKTAYEQSQSARDRQEEVLKNAIQGLDTVNYLVRQLRALGEESANAVEPEKVGPG